MERHALERMLAVVLVATLVAASAGALTGLAFIGEDLEQQGEWLDGVGVLIGLAVLGVVVAPGAVAGKALHAVLRRGVRAWRWALAAGIVGVLVVVPFGVFWHPAFLVAVVPLLVIVVAVQASRER